MYVYNFKEFIDLLGSAFLLIVFWGGALLNLLNWHIAKAYTESEGVTLYPAFILAFGILWQLIGGALLLNTSTVELGCILLILFIFTSSMQFHQFWRKNGVERYKSLIYFLSNVGVIGGLLLIMAQNRALKLPFNIAIPLAY